MKSSRCRKAWILMPRAIHGGQSMPTLSGRLSRFILIPTFLNGTHITLPIQILVSPIFDFDRESSDLFLALEAQLQKPDSGLLTALWFLYQSTFRSPSRSSFTEDIQNICTALEALVKTTRRGDTGNQVCEALVRIFTPQAAGAADAWAKRSPLSERTEVLEELEAWVRKLYEIRNAYTHGRTTFDFFFHGRSIWQDAFDLVRMAANRVILGRPEPRCLDGSRLEKRLMSVRYFDAAVSVLADKQRWMPGGKYRRSLRNWTKLSAWERLLILVWLNRSRA